MTSDEEIAVTVEKIRSKVFFLDMADTYIIPFIFDGEIGQKLCPIRSVEVIKDRLSSSRI